jgi:hypothetical protein
MLIREELLARGEAWFKIKSKIHGLRLEVLVIHMTVPMIAAFVPVAVFPVVRHSGFIIHRVGKVAR